MQRSIRYLATASAIVLIAGFTAACSSGSGEAGATGGDSATPAKDSVSIALNSGAPKNLDFTTTDGAAIPQALLGNVYEGLVALDDDGEIVPALAESWEVSDDNQTYTFKLHEDVKFSDGAEFTADDVKYSIERVKSDDWTISLKSGMDVVKDVEVVSPTEVAVHLEQPSNGWLYSMTTRIGAMFDTDGTTDLANQAIGTGPFEVSDFKHDTSLTLTARDDYWGEKPAVKTVTLKYFDDVNAQIAAIQSGDLDAISNLPDLNTLELLESDDSLVVTEGSSTGKEVLSMNNSEGLFADKRVRQAVNHAIDREALVEATANGYGQVTGSMVPPTDPWYNDLSGDYPYDPEKAMALLEEAGVANASFNIDVPNLPVHIAVAQVVKSDLAKVGLTAELKTIEFPAVWLDKVFSQADYEMSLINHVESRDLPIFADPNYYWRYDNAKVQDLIKSADAGTPEEQKTDLAEAMQILSDDAVADWLYLTANINVVQNGLEGLPNNAISESLNISKLTWN